MLTANSLKRSVALGPGIGASARGRAHSTTPFSRVIYSTAQVDNFCSHLQRIFADLQVEVTRPFGAPAVLKITLERVLKVSIVLRGASIEWVMVKAFNEDFITEEGKVDVFSPSRFLVFQKITDHANAAMLHFVHTLHPDLAVKSFVVS